MKYSTTFAAVIGSAAAQSAYGVPSSASPSQAATTTYACNPAHQYPEGVRCVSTAGSLTLVSPSATSSASETYACNPAHQYPEGVRCVSTAGRLALVSPSSVSASAPSKAPVTTGTPSDCSAKYDACRGGVDPNFSYCASQYAECLGYNPFASNGTNTATPASPAGDVYVTAIVTDYTTYCPGPTTLTHEQKTYTVTEATTLTLPCSAGCTVTKPIQSFPPATTVTAIVSSFTTYCPEPTTFTHQQSTYTVTKATTITLPCKGGCTVTTPVSALPPKSKQPKPSKPVVTGTGSPMKPTVVTAITTVCPTPTTFVHESKTITVTKATTLTLPCSTGCTVKPVATKPAASGPAPSAPAPSGPAPPVVPAPGPSAPGQPAPVPSGAPAPSGAPVPPAYGPSASAGVPSSVAAVPSRQATTSPVAYTGAAAPTAIPMAAAAVAAVGALFL